MAGASDSHAQIVRTKLIRPRLAPNLVDRGRLVDVMQSAAKKPLTLVSAPAGYGKSVLVSQWIEQAGRSVAWLSLDQEDSNLESFLACLLATIETGIPDAGRTAGELLEAPLLPSAPTICDQLIHDLTDLARPCVLVLDDYHRIDSNSPVHDLLNCLVNNMPAGVRLVLTTRQDPSLELARWRKENLVAEIRLNDLQFTEPETTAFLAGSGYQNIGDRALENLQSEVEGWAVGLQLVALALRHTADPDAFLQEMSGGLAITREYLLQEVLGAMSPQTRHFLLTSGILDRFCHGVLETLFDSGADAADFLQEIQDTNLFAIPLGGRREWFRYHHLFQELLLLNLHRQLSPQEIADLYLRASRWFEEAGLIDEALQYALAAGDVGRAAEMVAMNRQSAVNDDRWYSLEKWLALLPESEVQKNPELLMARAWVLIHNVRFEAVLPLADHIESMLGDAGDQDHLRGEIALFRGYVLYFMGDGAGSLQFMESALAHIPGTFYEARAQAEVINALAGQMEGKKGHSLRGLDALLAGYDSPQELRKTRLVITYVFIHFIAGDLEKAEASNLDMRAIAEGGGYAYASAWSSCMQGLIHLARFELAEAAVHLGASVAQRNIHFKRAAADSMVALMLTQQAQGKNDLALATRQLLRDYVASQNDTVLWTLLKSAEVRLSLMEGRLEIAENWLAEAGLATEGAMLWWLEISSVSRCRALIALGSKEELEEAEESLRELAATAEAQHNTLHLIEILALRAVTCSLQGRSRKAGNLAAKALDLARPGGIIFPFLEIGKPMADLLAKMKRPARSDHFVAGILAALKNAQIQDSPAESEQAGRSDEAAVKMSGLPGEIFEDLSPREMEVLFFLDKRLRNKEIADRINLSVHTIQHHLKQIYQKLDVHSRREAVVRARALGLLP